MGTFKFKPFAVFTRDNGSENWGQQAVAYPASDAQCVAGANNTNGAAELYHGNTTAASTGKLVFLGRWYLDGSSTPLDINSLPNGFIVNSATFTIKGGNQWIARPGDHYYVTFANRVEEEIPHAASSTYTVIISPVPSSLAVDALLVLRLDKTAVDGNQGFYNLIIDGTYSLWSFTYAIDTPTVNTIGPSNKVRLTSTYPAANALNLNGIVTNGIDNNGNYNALSDTGIAGIGLTWINLAGVTKYYFIPIRYIGIDAVKAGFDPITPVLLEFEIPPALALLIWQDPTIPGWPNVLVTPYIYGDGTQFSGWVALTPLTLTLVDASGVYKLVKDKTNDTLYNQIAPISTSNVKIPNPFIKTGFIGG